MIGIIRVPPKDAKSVAVPIVPKRIGIIYIEVFSILQMKEGESYMNSVGDAVRRELLVTVRVLSFCHCEAIYIAPNQNT